MRPRLSASKAAVELIKGFEGYRARAARLDDGRWTIGYGHTLTAREGAEVNRSDAEALLLYDLIQICHAINEHVFAPLNQNQFDALASFVLNIGVRAFRASPTLRRLNEGRPLDAALAMELWRKADLEGERIIIDALVRRRAAEKALFLTPPEGWTPAPTPVLQPHIDYDVVGLIPLHAPVAARAPLSGDRAYAERATEATVDLGEPPSASETAAAAVIDRLQSILAEPAGSIEAAATGAIGAAAPASGAEATNHPQLQAPIRPGVRESIPAVTFIASRRPPAWAGGVGLFFLAAVGVAFLALAGAWGFRPDQSPVFGLSARAVGLTVGVIGIVCFGVATYFVLERLGLPRDRR